MLKLIWKRIIRKRCTQRKQSPCYLKLIICFFCFAYLWAVPFSSSASSQKFGKYDDVVEITLKEGDNFRLSYRYSVYYFIIGIWVQSEGYILYLPAEGKYQSLGNKLPTDIVRYYGLTTDRPKPNFLSVAWIYTYGFLAEIIIVAITLLIIKARVSEYLRIKVKFENAIKSYTAMGGRDRTVMEILGYLRYKQKRELYVSFKCENQLSKLESGTQVEFPDGTQGTVLSPYENFLQQNLFYLESVIIEQLNYSFSKIISNYIFDFVRGEAINKNCVFFAIAYNVTETGSFYKQEDINNQFFLGITVNWNIDVAVGGKIIRNINFPSFPAEKFTVQSGSSIKMIFDEMAKTAFFDLNQRLQNELNIDILNRQ